MDERVSELIKQRCRSFLPPILCDRDKKILKDILYEIDNEIVKTGCPINGPNEERYWIYSTAFNKLVNNVTVYKDILADIKREYENCISAIRNGQREAVFLQAKLKALTSLPTTIAYYKRRQRELHEKLDILNQDNKRLEAKIQEVLKSGLDDDLMEEVEDEYDKSDNERVEYQHEQRPIPGMSTVDWTNEDLLQQAIVKLRHRIENIKIQKRTSYVPIGKKNEVKADFDRKIMQRDKLKHERRKMQRKSIKLKHGIEVLRGLDNDKQWTAEEIISKIKERSSSASATEQSLNRTSKDFYDEDDPLQEKEAEHILDYIDKFNEFFNEKEYTNAAMHAASSPKGVLRAMETLLRFKNVSENCETLPSPLLIYTEALMSCCAAQSHIPDKYMSIECVRCGLNENRFDMVTQWLTQNTVTPSKTVGELLVKYASENNHHWKQAMMAAHTVFVQLPTCRIQTASLLYQLDKIMSMLDFTYAARFTASEYFELLYQNQSCELVWLLSQVNFKFQGIESNLSTAQNYEPPLPLPLRTILYNLIQKNKNNSNVVVTLLAEIYDELRNYGVAAGIAVNENSNETASLYSLVYADGGSYEKNEEVKNMWNTVCVECEKHYQGDISLEIQASLIVSDTMFNAMLVITQDEKEQFDYYT